MAAAEKFCLRWNDFESNISVAFRELREEKDFFDVTLACEDSQVSAHKVILSACSPFFRNVLRKNPHQHPLLYLKGVKYQEMLSVLNFMYQGEVNVAQEELNSFLAVAEELRVKGLTQNTQETSKQRSPPPRDPVPPPKRPRPAPPPPAPTRTQQQVYRPQEQREEEVAEVQEVQTVKAEPREQQGYQENHESAVALEDTYQEDYGDYGQYEGQYEGIDPNTGLPLADGNKVKSKMGGCLEVKPEKGEMVMSMEPSVTIHTAITEDGNDGKDFYANANKDWEREVQLRMTKADNIWQCLECPYMSKNRVSVVSHIQGKHLEDFGGYLCKLCGSNSGTYCGFEKHMSRQHQYSVARRTVLGSASASKSINLSLEPNVTFVEEPDVSFSQFGREGSFGVSP